MHVVELQRRQVGIHPAQRHQACMGADASLHWPNVDVSGVPLGNYAMNCAASGTSDSTELLGSGSLIWLFRQMPNATIINLQDPRN